MDNEARDRVGGIVQRVKARVLDTMRRDLAIARQMYQSKTSEEKQVLKAWLVAAAILAKRGMGINPKALLLVELTEPGTDGDDLAVSISVIAAQRAIAIWDRGEEYLPSLNEFCGTEF